MNIPPLQIVPATRQGTKALIGLYGRSGGGKTRTGLLLARGIAGTAGKIVLIDTENGRGRIFADVIPGGYDVIDLGAPFSPERYAEALELAEGKADVVMFDSMTHEWDGEGGVLESHETELDRMAGSDWRKRDACNMAAWIKPKTLHKKFVQRLLRSKVPIICCLRAQEKTRMEKKDGKTVVHTDEFTTPIYDSKFIFEMLINAEVYSKNGVGGFLRITKITHETLFKCLPGENEQAGMEHGRLIRAWCDSAGAAPAPPPDEKDVLKKELWKITKAKHQGDPKALERWLITENIISDTETLEGLTKERLPKVVTDARLKLV